MDNVKYTFEQYKEDLNRIAPLMENIDHIIAIYRGSLPMGVHLSNIYDIPLSIIDYQSRDGNSSEPVMIKNNFDGERVYNNVLVIDDILDSGLTMDKVTKFLYDGWAVKPKLNYLTIYGKENIYDVDYLHEHTGEWIEFWWEIL